GLSRVTRIRPSRLRLVIGGSWYATKTRAFVFVFVDSFGLIITTLFETLNGFAGIIYGWLPLIQLFLKISLSHDCSTYRPAFLNCCGQNSVICSASSWLYPPSIMMAMSYPPKGLGMGWIVGVPGPEFHTNSGESFGII